MLESCPLRQARPFSRTDGWTVSRNDLALSRFLALDPGEAPAPEAKWRATGEGAPRQGGAEAEALEAQAPKT